MQNFDQDFPRFFKRLLAAVTADTNTYVLLVPFMLRRDITQITAHGHG